MKRKEGFFNIAGFPSDPLSTGTAAIQQKFKDTLPNVIYNNDKNIDLAGLTNTAKPAVSSSVSPLKNEWKHSTVPSEQFNTMQAACENTGNGDQFSHLSSLASSVDTSSRLRCGWVYNTADYTQGRGALGIISGPLKTTASGTWMWDLNAAKQKYQTDICSRITNCGDIGASMYQGRCGWCKKSGKAVPISGGEAAYPFSVRTACSPNNLITNGGQCKEGFTNPSTCAPLAGGSLSRDCLLQKIIGAGCNDAGSMYQSLKSGSDNDYLSQLRQQQSWSVYQARATAPLDETSLKSGKITIANALNNFNAVQQNAASNLNGGLQFAARDLCYKKGALDSYDFCTEISDSTTGPFTLDCLQKLFLTSGGQTSGRKFPSSSNASTWNAMGTWSAVKAYIQKLFADTRSSDRVVQENAMSDFYGITLENKQTPVVRVPVCLVGSEQGMPACQELSVRKGPSAPVCGERVTVFAKPNFVEYNFSIPVGEWNTLDEIRKMPGNRNYTIHGGDGNVSFAFPKNCSLQLTINNGENFSGDITYIFTRTCSQPISSGSCGQIEYDSGWDYARSIRCERV